MGKQDDLMTARKSDREVKTDEGPVPAPGMRIGPGPILAEELEARGLSAAAFATSCGLEQSVLEGVVSGKVPITPAMAKAIARALGTSEALWLNLERNWRK